jgi:hypothetical protein
MLLGALPQTPAFSALRQWHDRGVSSLKCQVSSRRSQEPCLYRLAAGRSCETKPIGGSVNLKFEVSSEADLAKRSQFRRGRKRGQVLYGKGITANQACRQPWKTKPIWKRLQVGSVKCQAGEAEGAGFRFHTSHSAAGRSCETNPIRGSRAGTGGVAAGIGFVCAAKEMP